MYLRLRSGRLIRTFQSEEKIEESSEGYDDMVIRTDEETTTHQHENAQAGLVHNVELEEGSVETTERRHDDRYNAFAIQADHNSWTSSQYAVDQYAYQDPDPPIVPRQNNHRLSSNTMAYLLSWYMCQKIIPLSKICEIQPRVVERMCCGPYQDLGLDRLGPLARQSFAHFRSEDQAARGQIFRPVAATPKEEVNSPFHCARVFRQVKSKIEHYQMRNLLVSTSERDAYVAKKWHVKHVDPSDPVGSSSTEDVMDLSTGKHFSGDIDWRISTLASSRESGVIFAGTFRGNLAYRPLWAPSIPIQHISVGSNKAVNAVSPTPHQSTVMVATNDGMLTTVDYYNNRIMRQETLTYDYSMQGFQILKKPVNSTMQSATITNQISCSADGRLRLLVGDFPHLVLMDSRSNQPSGIVESMLMCCNSNERCLRHATCAAQHQISSFGVSWCPFDAFTIATGSENGAIRLWDARMWRTVASLQGNSAIGSVTFTTLSGTDALCSGPILLAAEASDVVQVINARTGTSVQDLSFMGDVGGVAVTDNRSVLVLNSDRDFGGLMIWENDQYPNYQTGDAQQNDFSASGVSSHSFYAARDLDFF